MPLGTALFTLKVILPLPDCSEICSMNSQICNGTQNKKTLKKDCAYKQSTGLQQNFKYQKWTKTDFESLRRLQKAIKDHKKNDRDNKK